MWFQCDVAKGIVQIGNASTMTDNNRNSEEHTEEHLGTGTVELCHYEPFVHHSSTQSVSKTGEMKKDLHNVTQWRI